MTIIVFLIDTSASMFQRTYIGGRTTLLDVAKSAVETFVKIRQRSMDSRIDRYMLLTFEESPNNIKAGWKENLATFMNELKNLQCFSMTTMGVAVKQAFDILNINRMTSGIDTYGQGRCPFFLETSVIVLITDGGKLTTVNGVQEEFNLPMHSPVPGSEMTREPFRWDQRLFALVLRLAGTPAIERDTGLVPSDHSPIDAMCEVTGGRSYCITSHRMLNQCIDSLVQKVQNGVVINFEKIGPDPPPPAFDKNEVEGGAAAAGGGKDEGGYAIKDMEGVVDENGRMNLGNQQSLPPSLLSTSWHNCRKMIYVPKSNKSYCVGFWPIPESFWPEVTASVLPARSAHPNIKFACTNSEPMVIENLPFDKYELEPSPLTQFILSRKQPKTCWQVFVANSYKNSEVGHPFGYLKASTNLTCVNLFVMPYNYPVLLPLLEELSKMHRWKPSNDWRTQFQNYLRTLPAYYAGPLRRALTRMGTPLALAQTLIPENSENLSYSVSNYLKRLKNQAKVEYDKLCSEIILRQSQANSNLKTNSEQIRVLPKVTLKKELISHPLLSDKFAAQRDQLVDQANSFLVTLDNKERQAVSFKNPFDIPRDRLVQQAVRMRNNFLQSDWNVLDQDSAHSLPISQMGNYQEYLKRQTPQLREIESAPVRQHMFGNPFKIDKRMMVDEADIDLVGSPGGGGINIGGGSASATGGGGGGASSRASKRTNQDALMTGGGGANSRIPLKRKPGPLPKNFLFRRPSTSSSMSSCGSDVAVMSPQHSPCPSPTPSVLAPSPVPWLSGFEKDLPSFDDRSSNLISASPMNGPSSPDGSASERSRSPSPPLDTLPTYGSTAQNNPNSNNNNNSSSLGGVISTGATTTTTTTSIGEITGSFSASVGSALSATNRASSLSSSNTHFYSTAAAATTTGTTNISGTSTNLGSMGAFDSTTVSAYSSISSSYASDFYVSTSPATAPSGGHSQPQSQQNDSSRVAAVTPAVLQITKDTTNSVLGHHHYQNTNSVTTNSEIKILSSSSSNIMTKVTVIENREEIDSQNNEIRKTLHKLVRKPGKNFTELFDHLKTLKGNAQVQIAMVELIIKESLRFKRQHLAHLLEEYIRGLLPSDNKILLV